MIQIKKKTLQINHSEEEAEEIEETIKEDNLEAQIITEEEEEA